MQSKLYGLKILRDDKSYWSECHVFSHSVQKLKGLALLPEGVSWYAERSDVDKSITELNTVTYTTNYDLREPTTKAGPYFKIVELPLVI